MKTSKEEIKKNFGLMPEGPEFREEDADIVSDEEIDSKRNMFRTNDTGAKYML